MKFAATLAWLAVTAVMVVVVARIVWRVSDALANVPL